ncbi:FkbM family methyltransferase [Candidatus Pelagibacter bacterium]|nr:FkbM family methyltransferase [Candidatus Pelagibacter bacterium]MDA9619082.1 FkbM family methyltransferase [Candidatus Pelagibacter bacterium]
MSTKNSNFLSLAKKFTFLKKIYFFYNIYIRNYKFIFKSSQFDEEKKIIKLLDKNLKGNYVDLGCFHPTRLNNTFHLYKKGWKGINIDLNPLTIELFNFARPKDINVCAVISNQKIKKKLYFLGELDSKNTIDINHKNWLSSHFKIKKKDFKIKNVKATTLGHILEKYKLYNIDYLNIDIEGHELDVLKTFNFKKFKINVICVELLSFNKISAKRKNQLISLLKKNKFKLVDKSEINYIFKRIK